mmetsp:Transcript_52381/g.150961  ORF Transcript_52381/g.150961 Transcript_52381/m.150961 type:complete len:172 (-) Transcript_52381:170-685(-)
MRRQRPRGAAVSSVMAALLLAHVVARRAPPEGLPEGVRGSALLDASEAVFPRGRNLAEAREENERLLAELRARGEEVSSLRSQLEENIAIVDKLSTELRKANENRMRFEQEMQLLMKKNAELSDTLQEARKLLPTPEVAQNVSSDAPELPESPVAQPTPERKSWWKPFSRR